MTSTQYTTETGIRIGRDGLRSWRHFDTNDGRFLNPRPVGPKYSSKAELLADHADYLRRAGWLK